MENEEKMREVKNCLEQKQDDYLDEKIRLDGAKLILEQERRLSIERSRMLDLEAQQISIRLKKDEEMLLKMQLEAKEQKNKEENGKIFYKKKLKFYRQAQKHYDNQREYNQKI